MSTVQRIGTHATTLLQGAHCALRLSKWYVQYNVWCPETKRPPPLAVSLLLARQKCLWALVTVAPGRRRITRRFIGGKLTMGGKPSLGHTNKLLERFPRQKKAAIVSEVVSREQLLNIAET